jgi:hypothetical protein
MAEMFNLKAVRKANARAEEKVKAAESRALFGRTKAQKAADAAAKAAAAKALDQARRET